MTASTSRPRARSLTATHACGVNVPAVVPVVWSSPRLMTMNRGIVPFFANSSYSSRNDVDVVGVADLFAGLLRQPVVGADVADQAGDAAPPSWSRLGPSLTRLPYSP